MNYSNNTASRHYGYFLIVGLCWAALQAVVYIVGAVKNVISGSWWLIFLITAVGLALVIYVLVNYVYYRRVKLERICEAKLERVTAGKLGYKGFQFDAELDGKKFTAVTKKVFIGGNWPPHPNKIEKYSCRTVTIGFDAKRCEFIVI